MVLFKEDEKRIKALEKAEKLAKRTKLGFWVRRFVKIGFVLAILFSISLGLLAGLGGSHKALKKGIEDYLTQASGLQATIGEFNDMTFFPDVALDTAQISLRKKGEATPLVTIGKIKFSSGFFNLMFSRQRVEILEIDNISVAPGVLGDQALMINKIGLEGQREKNTPSLIVDGHYGERKIALDMLVEQKEGVFSLPEKGNFKVRFGDFEAQGTTERIGWGGGTLFQISSLGLPENILSGEVVIKKNFSKKHVKADLEFGDSQLQAALDMSSKYLKGSLNFPSLDLGDIKILARLYGFMDGLPVKKDSELIDFYGWVVDLDITAKELRGKESALGHINLNIMLENQLAKASLDGNFSGGDLNGTFDLDSASLPAALTIKAALKEWDYGLYQKAMLGRENVSGKANITLDLQTQGKTYSELMAGLTGKAILIAGQGKMASEALNIWGGGLVNALLPSLNKESETTLNCMIADFKIKDSIARPDPLFVDTSRVTVSGEGQINLFENKIDLTLNPKAKNPALLNIATSLNIKGSILKPEIKANTASLLGTLGGLALGLVNPAFLVLSMSDMGITEDHPCFAFIGKPDSEKTLPKKTLP